MTEVSSIVRSVGNLAYSAGYWPRLQANDPVSLEVLKSVLCAIGLNEVVVRTARIVPDCPALRDTWGDQEEHGYLKLDLQVRQALIGRNPGEDVL